MSNLICYCFGYTELDITNEVLKNNGRSLIFERILNEKKNGTCQCETKHPQGR